MCDQLRYGCLGLVGAAVSEIVARQSVLLRLDNAELNASVVLETIVACGLVNDYS